MSTVTCNDRKLTIIYETSVGSIPYVAKKKKEKKKTIFRRINPFDPSHGIVWYHGIFFKKKKKKKNNVERNQFNYAILWDKRIF